MARDNSERNKRPFADVVADWQHHLLELGRRNNLLYFRSGKTGIHIINHTPDSIAHELPLARRGLTFDYAEPSTRRYGGQFRTASGDDEVEQEPHVVGGDLKADCPVLELQSRLGRLRRKAKEWEEEQGLNVSFLAIGFLRWVDEDGEDAIAPLLLLPCHLEKSSLHQAFALTPDDDDAGNNPTLAVKLEEFGITLPEFDPGGQTPGDYLRTVRDLIKHKPKWQVVEDVYLSTFAYSKLPMWRDLEVVRVNGTDHRVIRALATGEILEEGDIERSPHATPDLASLAGGKLDDILTVRDQFAVLPADYSQLLAIASARSGTNLVVHGPPGTGKSQTIANIIATFLAEGKSVLFVSEKTAALDIVKHRLDEKQLGVFCLDLHSERGNKASVYQQLQYSVDDRRSVRRFEFDYTALELRRQHLNKMVRALHEIRSPLGRTVFEVQGRFSAIRGTIHVPFKVEGMKDLDQVRLSNIMDSANRVGLKHREFKEHLTSHWRVLKFVAPPIELSDRIRDDMHRIATAVHILQTSASSASGNVRLPPPDTLRRFHRIESICRHMTKATGVPPGWVQEDVPKRLLEIARRQIDIQTVRNNVVANLTAVFGTPLPQWDFEHFLEELAVGSEENRSISLLFGDRWDQLLTQNQKTMSRALETLGAGISRLTALASGVSVFLKMDAPQTWKSISYCQYLAKRIGGVPPVPPRWIDSEAAYPVDRVVDEARKLADNLALREKALFSEFDPAIVDIVDHHMVTRYRTEHQSRLRRTVFSTFRRDRHSIESCLRTPTRMPISRQFQLIHEIEELKRVRKAWEEAQPELKGCMGNRYAGRNTAWELVLNDINTVREILNENGADRARFAQLLTQADFSSQCRAFGTQLENACAEVQPALYMQLDAKLASQVKGGTISMSALQKLIASMGPTVKRLEGAADIPLSAARQKVDGLSLLRDLLELGAKLSALERELSEASGTLGTEFGTRFRGFATDWSEVVASLDWTQELLELVGTEQGFQALLDQAEHPMRSSVYERIADSTASALAQFKIEIDSLVEGYDLDNAGPWDSWIEARFDSMLEWCAELSNDADSAAEWLSYKDAVAAMDEAVGSGVVDRIRRDTDDSKVVPMIVERRVLGAWLDWVYSKDSSLARFVAEEHEDVISKFKELDIQSMAAAQNEVRKRVYERYPTTYGISSKNSELGILRNELAKRRRQWPVRRLLRTIPRLVQTLKPCFLVSPLAVSQYLPFSAATDETLMFDAVIFDEASQVFPEDAVPAILRGKQLILAGDQKQLPPTTFWRRTNIDEDVDLNGDEDDVSANQLEGKDSILDTAVAWHGRLFEDAHLNVHYRSRDESLIRFSNHHFYRDSLLTFPCPGTNDTWRGIHDVFVPDGRYDAGATRCNRKEADRVVGLVFEHMRTRPASESLGVVALSRAQADLIDRLIDERRLLERDVDQRFDEISLEPFFVKNLENVQGDERDHMIFSVGYGPTTESGAVPNRFGPLNALGGERRLNVVISRARQRFDVVHSIKASDIHSEQEGARLLRRYLEYAADPLHAFEADLTIDTAAEPESSFEAAVGETLVAKGYRIDRQIGVAGYRIDLAIMSEDGSKHDLGIECDGWTYHSAPAARDRDYMRQKVLEGLGWKLHRVWSTAWTRNPEAELSRIEASLKAARSDNPPQETARPDDQGPEVLPESRADDIDVGAKHAGSSILSEITLDEYQRASLPNIVQSIELRDETPQNLVPHVVTISEVEGPVHIDVVIERIRECYHIGRVRGSTRENVEQAVKLAIDTRVVRSEGNFLWVKDSQRRRNPRHPVDGDIEHIPPTEIAALTIAVAGTLFGAPRADLVVEVSRSLGFGRTGGRINEVIEKTIAELLSEGRLVETFGMVHVPDSESEVDRGIERARTNEVTKPATTTKSGDKGVSMRLADRLRANGLEVVDKRSSGGSLWVVGGPDLKGLVPLFSKLGVRFQFAPRGGQATRNRPGWWTSSRD